MAAGWKPEGYASVSPYLIVDGAQRMIDFLEATFGAHVVRRDETPDGSILHAEVRIDDTVVMIGDAGGEWLAQQVGVHVYVEDVETTYQRALAAGGRSVEEPQEQPDDPDRRGGIRDPAGNIWWIATRL